MAEYLKKNGKNDYLNDIVEIEHARLNNLKHTILGCMLGDFDDTGKYVISSRIAEELISMPKFIIDTVDNIDICQGELILDKSITFAVSFEEDCATLSLLEKVNYGANFKLNSGVYSDVIETIIDRVETSGVVDRNAIYRMWNISEFGGNRIDILSCGEEVLQKYFGITARFNYLMKANKELLEKESELEEIESEYTLAIFESMSKYPKFKEAVLATIRKTTIEKSDFVKADKPNYAKTLNELLENAIEENAGLLDEKQKEEFAVDRRNALRNKNVKAADLLHVESMSVDTVNGKEQGIDGVIIYTIAGSGRETITNNYFGDNVGIDSKTIRVSVEDFAKAKSAPVNQKGEQKSKLNSVLSSEKLVVENSVKTETNKTTNETKGGAVADKKPEVKKDASSNLVKKAAAGAKKPVKKKSPQTKTDTKKDAKSQTKKPTTTSKGATSKKTSLIYGFAGETKTSRNVKAETDTKRPELLDKFFQQKANSNSRDISKGQKLADSAEFQAGANINADVGI